MNSTGRLVPASRRFTAAALAVAVCLSVPAAASAVPAPADLAGSARAVADYPPELATYYTQTLSWSPCADDLVCAWLTVPLDYSNPAGPTIQIRVNKAKATGSAANRQGSMVVNPGGPGAAGLDFTGYVARTVAPKVNQQFDIVGFDPRGIGESAPITCLTGRQTTVWLRQDGSPDTPAEEARLMSLARGISNGCLRMSPDLARNIGTVDTVRDLDVLRAALGDAKLTWLGYSYGTYIGTVYAEMFPDHVGRFVLDGAVDPANDGMQLSRGQSHGFQVAVGRFAEDCAERASCPYSGGAKGVIRGINSLLARLDVRPMPTDSGERVTQAYGLTAIFLSMYSTSFWPSLRQALGQAKKGDGTGLLSLSDYSNDRTGPNTYGSNMTSAFYAIGCWDGPATPNAAGLRAAAASWSRGARVPEMARSMSWGNAPCSVWFDHSDRTPAPAQSTTTSPILVVGTSYDPATPYPWAVALSQQLATATLLTWIGDGHTAYGSGSQCIDSAIDSYFLTGTPPPAGTVCR